MTSQIFAGSVSNVSTQKQIKLSSAEKVKGLENTDLTVENSCSLAPPGVPTEDEDDEAEPLGSTPPGKIRV